MEETRKEKSERISKEMDAVIEKYKVRSPEEIEKDRFLKEAEDLKKEAAEMGGGLTALHLADSPQMIEHLAMEKFNPNVKDDSGNTPLHYASGKNTLALIEVGANVNSQDKAGQTPLHAALSRGDIETAKILIENGASLRIKDSLGHTPVDCLNQAIGNYQMDGKRYKEALAFKDELQKNERLEEKLANRFNKATKGGKEALNATKEGAKNVVDSVKEGVKEIAGSVKEGAKEIAGSIKTGVQSVRAENKKNADKEDLPRVAGDFNLIDAIQGIASLRITEAQTEQRFMNEAIQNRGNTGK